LELRLLPGVCWLPVMNSPSVPPLLSPADLATGDILFRHAVPAFGVLLASVMFISPMPSVMHARAKGSLGELNPLPWMIILLNGISWMGYGLMVDDWYMTAAMVVGILCGGFYVVTGVNLSSQAQLKTIEWLIYPLAFMLITTVVITVRLAETHEQTARLLFGVTGTFFNLLMYFVPLSTLAVVLKTRSAASISGPLSCTSMANCVMWSAYGIVIDDPFIYMPVVISGVFSLALVTLKLLLRSTPRETSGGSSSPQAPA